MSKFCPNCGHENKDVASFCGNCGSKLVSSNFNSNLRDSGSSTNTSTNSSTNSSTNTSTSTHKVSSAAKGTNDPFSLCCGALIVLFIIVLIMSIG